MTAPNPGAGLPPGGWKVVAQVPRTIAAPGAGGVIPGYQITFVVASGATGSVFVPQDGYSADAVRAAITPLAAQLSAVADLTHES